MTISGLQLTSPTADLAEQCLTWRPSGQGMATALAGEALANAFGRLGLRRVQAGCFADDVASWRVLEKLGMRREQHGVEDSFPAELGWVDGYTYAVLAEEWRQVTGNDVPGHGHDPCTRGTPSQRPKC